MSIEEDLAALWGVINDLTEAIEHLTKLLELQQGIEAGELEMHGPGERTIFADLSGRGETPEGETPPEPMPSSSDAEGMNEKTLELIALAKELGYQYLYHNGRLAIDNRVLDEFNRRHLETNLDREV